MINGAQSPVTVANGYQAQIFLEESVVDEFVVKCRIHKTFIITRTCRLKVKKLTILQGNIQVFIIEIVGTSYYFYRESFFLKSFFLQL